MRHVLSTALIAIAMLPSLDKPVHAAEAAIGVYVLGSRSAGAGIRPPPGVYFQNDTFFYSGKIGGGTTLATGGLLVANVSATTWINPPMTRWAPSKILSRRHFSLQR